MSIINQSEENQSQELPPEQHPVPITFLFMGEDEQGRIVVSQQLTVGVTPIQVAQLMFTVIPDWMKDSRIAIPIEAKEGVDPQMARGQQQLLETGRIAFKGFVAASGMLLSMARDLYGPDFQQQPRADSLPIISRWLAWFVASQVAKAPLEIVVSNGIITDIRQSQRVPVRGDNAETSRDYSAGENEE